MATLSLCPAARAQDLQAPPGAGDAPGIQPSEGVPQPDSGGPPPAAPAAAGEQQPEASGEPADGAPSPVDAQAPGQEAPSDATEISGGVDIGTLPHDLSPWGMFMAADIVVQAVIVGLVIASIVTWTVWLVKSLELWTGKLRVRRALALIEQEPSLADASRRLGKRRGVAPALVDAALAELRLSDGATDKAGIKERAASRVEGIQIAAARQINTGTGLLATIGATAPFVGLFGTVWGIMNSFIGISEAQTTNLAVVAPGIAEALLATALGLAAAIPAVIIYNHFSRSIAGYRALVGDTAAEVMRQLSRELDTIASSRKRNVQRAAE